MRMPVHRMLGFIHFLRRSSRSLETAQVPNGYGGPSGTSVHSPLAMAHAPGYDGYGGGELAAKILVSKNLTLI